MFDSKSISLKGAGACLLFVAGIAFLSACSTTTLPPELAVTPITIPTSAPRASDVIPEPVAIDPETGYPIADAGAQEIGRAHV